MSSKLQYKAAPSASEVPTEVLHEGFTHNEVSTEPEAIPQAPEITIEGGEDIQAAEVPCDLPIPSAVADEPIHELASIRAPYQGEDARVTLLRELDEKLLEWAALSSGSKSQKLGGNSQEQGGQSHNLYVTIPIDCARLYQLATRGSIQVIEGLQKHNGGLERNNYQLQCDNQRLQDTVLILQMNNGQLQSRCFSMEERMHSLESNRIKSDDWQKTAIELESRVGRLKREISDLREQLEVARLGQESIEAVELVGESGAGELGEGEVTVSPWCKTDGHKGQGEKRRRIE